MKNFMDTTITVLVLMLVVGMIFPQQSMAAVGCTLNEPDRDIKRIFPQSTGYKTEFITIKERGGNNLAREIKKRLNDILDPIYESIEVPYAYYTVLKGKQVIGYVHGVNQKGMYGGMQLILATDLKGRIVDFYYQRISSPEAKQFRSNDFTKHFVGLTVEDFYEYDQHHSGPVSKIKDPSQRHAEDFWATLRGVKKNFILLSIFKVNEKSEKLLEKEGNNDHQK